MKKTIVIGIIALMAIGFSFAVYLANTKEEALSYIDTKIAERDDAISSASITATYTTDKVCSVNLDKEIRCKLCFDFEYNKETIDTCITTRNGSTTKEDDAKVRDKIMSIIDRDYMQENAEYTEAVRTGDKVTI